MSISQDEVDVLNDRLNNLLQATGRLRAAGVDVPVEITSSEQVNRIIALDKALEYFTGFPNDTDPITFTDGTTQWVVTRADVGL